MNKYLVLFATKTSIEFIPKNADHNFLLSGTKLRFRRIMCPQDKVISNLSHGWIVEVRTSEQELETAITKSWEIVEFFLTTCCIEAGCEIFRSNVVLGYEITENIEKRTFRQYFDNIPMSSKPMGIEFSSYSSNLKKIWNANSEEYSGRILRAMRWFRKGINGDDPIDQFIFFWHGLETLNSTLANHYGVKKAGKIEIDTECKVCGETYKYSINSKAGIERLYDDVGIEKRVKKDINSVRNGVAHGYENISQLLELSTELLPTMAQLLHTGISNVTGSSHKDEVVQNLNRVSPIKTGGFVFVDMNLFEKDTSKLGINGYYPYFVHTIKEAEGQFESSIVPKLTCKYEQYGFGISGKDINLDINQIE